MSFRTFVPRHAAPLGHMGGGGGHVATVGGTSIKSPDPGAVKAVVPQPPPRAGPGCKARKRRRGSASGDGGLEPAGRRLVQRHSSGSSASVNSASGAGGGGGCDMAPDGAASSGWSAEENRALRDAVMEFGERKRDWPKVANLMAKFGRDKEACRRQWLTLRPPVKGSWTVEEDRLLARIVMQSGPSGWSAIAKHIAGRNAKQCRERWVNHLNPNVKKSQWTAEEDKLLLLVQARLGNKWSEIAKQLPGRPDNAVKNRWYTLKNRAGEGGGRKRARKRSESLATATSTERKRTTSFDSTPDGGGGSPADDDASGSASVSSSQHNLGGGTSGAGGAGGASGASGAGTAHGDSSPDGGEVPLATLLARCANMDITQLDPKVQGDIVTLASRFSQLAAKHGATPSRHKLRSTRKGTTTTTTDVHGGADKCASAQRSRPLRPPNDSSTGGGPSVKRATLRFTPLGGESCDSLDVSMGMMSMDVEDSVAGSASHPAPPRGGLVRGLIASSQPSLGDVSCDDSLLNASLASDGGGGGCGGGGGGAMDGGMMDMMNNSISGALGDSFTSELLTALEDSLGHGGTLPAPPVAQAPSHMIRPVDLMVDTVVFAPPPVPRTKAPPRIRPGRITTSALPIHPSSSSSTSSSSTTTTTTVSDVSPPHPTSASLTTTSSVSSSSSAPIPAPTVPLPDVSLGDMSISLSLDDLPPQPPSATATSPPSLSMFSKLDLSFLTRGTDANAADTLHAAATPSSAAVAPASPLPASAPAATSMPLVSTPPPLVANVAPQQPPPSALWPSVTTPTAPPSSSSKPLRTTPSRPTSLRSSIPRSSTARRHNHRQLAPTAHFVCLVARQNQRWLAAWALAPAAQAPSGQPRTEAKHRS